MNRIVLFFSAFLPIAFFSSCKNKPESVTKNSSKIEHSIDSAYPGWQIAEGEKIKFRYPTNWDLKIKELDGNTKAFGLIEKTDKDYGNFVVLEIYEVKTQNRPFKEFKFGSIDWLAKRFENKINVRNTEDITYKGLEARKYEVEIPRDNTFDPAELYAINGKSRYYLFFLFKNLDSDLTVKNIMNSALFYK